MSAPADDANAAVISYATPKRRRTNGHATLAVVALAAISLDVAAFRSRTDELLAAAVLLHVAAAYLTPVVILLRRPGSIHWVAGTLFFLGMTAGVPVALLVAGVLMNFW